MRKKSILKKKKKKSSQHFVFSTCLENMSMDLIHLNHRWCDLQQFSINVFCNVAISLSKVSVEECVKHYIIQMVRYPRSFCWMRPDELSARQRLTLAHTRVLTKPIFKALSCRSIWNWNVEVKWTCLELECGVRKKLRQAFVLLHLVLTFSVHCVQSLCPTSWFVHGEAEYFLQKWSSFSFVAYHNEPGAALSLSHS